MFFKGLRIAWYNVVCSSVHAHFDLVIVSKLCLYKMYRNIFDFLKENLCIYLFYFLAGKWRLFGFFIIKYKRSHVYILCLTKWLCFMKFVYCWYTSSLGWLCMRTSKNKYNERSFFSFQVNSFWKGYGAKVYWM